MLTGEGEQLLSDCRGLLNYASALGERAQLLRRGDTGVLKVAASPQFIEGVISGFLHRYAERYPNVQVKLIEAIAWSDTLGMLERGEIHLGQNLLRAVQSGDPRFANHPLEAVDLLAACHAPLMLGKSGAIEIARLAALPAACAGYQLSYPAVLSTPPAVWQASRPISSSRAGHRIRCWRWPRGGHGVAIVPSAVRIDRYALRIARVTYRGKPLREPLAIFWDKRRPLPRYATAFCAMLAEHVREVFPISRPSEPKDGTPDWRTVTRRSARAGPR